MALRIRIYLNPEMNNRKPELATTLAFLDELKVLSDYLISDTAQFEE